jgi:hypothetical protein
MEIANMNKNSEDVRVYAVQRGGDNEAGQGLAQIVSERLPIDVLDVAESTYNIFGFTRAASGAGMILIERMEDGRAYAINVAHWELVFGPMDSTLIEDLVKAGFLKRVE